MYKFSSKSIILLRSCHPDLQKLFYEVIKHIDCKIIEGHRDEQRQNHLFHQGLSKLRFPDSNHNSFPSNAVDVVPCPLNWKDRESFVFLGGIVKGIASQMGIGIRWGGDWDGDNNLKDQTFFDLVHYELRDLV